jgi:hypothetical protein
VKAAPSPTRIPGLLGAFVRNFSTTSRAAANDLRAADKSPAVSRYQRFEGQVTGLFTTGHEPLEQLPIGQADAGADAEERLHLVGVQLGECIRHDG